MRLIFCSRCIPRNYQTNLIVNPSASKQPRSCSISSESAWSNYARTETFVIICHHTTPATYTDTRTKPAYAIWEKAWNLVLGEHKSNTNCLEWSSDPREFEVKGLGVRIVNDMFTLGLLLMTFFSRGERRGWGPLISPLSSLTGLWGVICKYGSVMNLFSFSKPPRCLLNHQCSTWATILSPTAALALLLSTAQSGVDCKQIQAFCPVRCWFIDRVFSLIVSFADLKWSELKLFLLLSVNNRLSLSLTVFWSVVDPDDVWHFTLTEVSVDFRCQTVVRSRRYVTS